MFRYPILPDTPSAASARRRRWSEEWSRPSTTSCWTLPHSDGCFVKAYAGRDHRGLLRRSRRGVLVPGRGATEHLVRQHEAWRWPRSWETAGTSVFACSLNASVLLPVRGPLRPSRQGQRQGQGGGAGGICASELPGSCTVVRELQCPQRLPGAPLPESAGRPDPGPHGDHWATP